MQVTVSGRRVPVSDRLRHHAVDKVGGLDRHLPRLDRAHVHFWHEHTPVAGQHLLCEVHLDGPGTHVGTAVRAPDGFTALDLAVDRLDAQLRRTTGKALVRSHGR